MDLKRNLDGRVEVESTGGCSVAVGAVPEAGEEVILASVVVA